MKTASDPRHQHRIALMQKAFSLSFTSHAPTPETNEIEKHLGDIDARITAAAPEWPIDKIAKIDLAILRLAIYELTVVKKEPPKVVIDEAVELGKEFGNEKSASFVNGVLGTVLKTV